MAQKLTILKYVCETGPKMLEPSEVYFALQVLASKAGGRDISHPIPLF